MTGHLDSSLSSLSTNDSPTQIEDWDRSLIISDVESSSCPLSQPPSKETPRNSIVFPVDSDTTPGRTRAITMEGSTRGERSLSELLRLHAQKGTDVKYSAEEALQVAEVLGQWINASSSPYESEDDFFTRSHDDLLVPSKSIPLFPSAIRPRGQSESANSRPTSSTGFAQ